MEGDGSLSSDALVAWLRPSCDLAGTTQVATDKPGTQRYERTRTDAGGTTIVRAYVFAGGCVLEHYRPPADLRVQPADEAKLAIGLVSRDDLATALGEHSGGRLQLDPDQDGGGSRP